MGNTSSSHKDPSTDTPRAEADHDLLLVPLRERFEELAAPPPPPSTAPLEDAEEQAAATTEGAATARGQGHGQEEERFVLFDNWSQLGGPRGAQVAARLYAVLDANGDGRLDFQEFSSASCLLKGSPDESKVALLFKMYGDADKGGLVGQEGLKAFILDIIAASPPPLAPLTRGDSNGHGRLAIHTPPSPFRRRESDTGGGRGAGGGGRGAGEGGRGGAGMEGGGGDETDLELELDYVLARMAEVVLTEYDADSDGMLTEKEWRAYLKREEEAVSAFLNALSDSVGKLLLP